MLNTIQVLQKAGEQVLLNVSRDIWRGILQHRNSIDPVLQSFLSQCDVMIVAYVLDILLAGSSPQLQLSNTIADFILNALHRSQIHIECCSVTIEDVAEPVMTALCMVGCSRSVVIEVGTQQRLVSVWKPLIQKVVSENGQLGINKRLTCPGRRVHGSIPDNPMVLRWRKGHGNESTDPSANSLELASIEWRCSSVHWL